MNAELASPTIVPARDYGATVMLFEDAGDIPLDREPDKSRRSALAERCTDDEF
jgi:hypothetical protein